MVKTKLRTREDAERVMQANGHTFGEWRWGGGGRYWILVCETCDSAAVLGDTHVYGSAIDNPCGLRWLKNRADKRNVPVFDHDCEACTFIGCYRLRHPYTDDGSLEGDPAYAGYRTGVPGKIVTMGDVYLACEGSGSRYLIRYGICGEYATTNKPARYVLAPMVDGDDDFDSRPLIEQLQEANANAPALDVALPYDIVFGDDEQ